MIELCNSFSASEHFINKLILLTPFTTRIVCLTGNNDFAGEIQQSEVVNKKS